MMELIFISVAKTVECAAVALAFTALFAPMYLKPLGILQSAGYAGGRLARWTVKKNNAYYLRQSLLFMLCLLSCAVVGLCFSFAGGYAALIGLIPYAVFFILYAVEDKKRALRVPVSFTPRLKRLYCAAVFFTAVFSYIAVCLLNFADIVWGNAVFSALRYCPLSVFPFLGVPILLLSNLVMKIYEVPHNKSYVRAAGKKLAASGIKTVGITGSYGKTSVKHILSAMLAAKYRVLSTPRSHNTPLGLALTVNSADLGEYDIFVAEMGARHVGDIAELCAFCPPSLAVITGICPQHLESFGSLENIVKAKGEILSAAAEAVIAPSCAEYFSDYSVKKYVPDCVSDVECTCGGTSFTLTIGGESERVMTRLLGRQAAENIGVAACAAHALGVDLGDICKAVRGLDFVEHRLQLITQNGVNILDDGYNSNVTGAAAAIETLKLFGGRRICVTPGLVELGILEESENYALGKELVGLDRVILVGETLIASVKRGYLENGGEAEKISLAPTLSAAQEELKGYIRTGDSVLFLNDLPDIY